MKLKLKTVLMSAKAEVSLQSKYRLKKNSLEAPMTATYKVRYIQSTLV